MGLTNAYGSYLKQEVDGASQGKLIIMMYDATIKFMRASIKAIDEKNVPEAHNNIIRAENIIYELMSTLNIEKGGEVAQSLLGLYDFMIWHLVDANSTKSKDKVNEVINLMIPLRDAWKEIVNKEEQAASAPKENKSINFAG